MRGQKRPRDEMTRVVALAEVVGDSEASRQTGIPRQTVQHWHQSPEFGELRQRTKDEVAAEWWAMVQKAFRRSTDLLEDTDDPVKAATAGAIMFDKMALSRGEATSRTESRSWTDDLNDDEKRRLRDWIDSLDTATPAGQDQTSAVED